MNISTILNYGKFIAYFKINKTNKMWKNKQNCHPLSNLDTHTYIHTHTIWETARQTHTHARRETQKGTHGLKHTRTCRLNYTVTTTEGSAALAKKVHYRSAALTDTPEARAVVSKGHRNKKDGVMACSSRGTREKSDTEWEREHLEEAVTNLCIIN